MGIECGRTYVGARMLPYGSHLKPEPAEGLLGDLSRRNGRLYAWDSGFEEELFRNLGGAPPTVGESEAGRSANAWASEKRLDHEGRGYRLIDCLPFQVVFESLKDLQFVISEKLAEQLDEMAEKDEASKPWEGEPASYFAGLCNKYGFELLDVDEELNIETDVLNTLKNYINIPIYMKRFKHLGKQPDPDSKPSKLLELLGRVYISIILFVPEHRGLICELFIEAIDVCFGRKIPQIIESSLRLCRLLSKASCRNVHSK